MIGEVNNVYTVLNWDECGGPTCWSGHVGGLQIVLGW